MKTKEFSIFNNLNAWRYFIGKYVIIRGENTTSRTKRIDGRYIERVNSVASSWVVNGVLSGNTCSFRHYEIEAIIEVEIAGGLLKRDCAFGKRGTPFPKDIPDDALIAFGVTKEDMCEENIVWYKVIEEIVWTTREGMNIINP